MLPVCDFCPSPIQYPYYHKDDAVVVVVDVLRAGTSIVWAMKNGASHIIPVGDEKLAERLGLDGYLVGAERNAKRCPFADMGNDPLEYTSEIVEGREIVLTTTNGTQAVEQALASGARDIIVGSFANLTAVARYCRESSRSVIVLASGWKNTFCREDTFFAGALFDLLLLDAGEASYLLTDSSCMALELYRLHHTEAEAYLSEADHHHRLVRTGFPQAVEYCLRRDLTDIVPRLSPYTKQPLCSWAFVKG